MAIAQVVGQHTSAESTTTALTLTLTNNPTAGNLVVVGFSILSTGLTITVQDANSNTYTATTNSPATQAAVGVMAGIWYLPNAPANASKTINITWGGASLTVDAAAQEYSGAATTSVLESDATHVSATSQTNVNDPSITTTNNGDLLWGLMNTGAGVSITSINSPWTVVDALHTIGSSEDFIQTTAGARAVSFTQSGAHQWIAVEAAFIAAAGAAAGVGLLIGHG